MKGLCSLALAFGFLIAASPARAQAPDGKALYEKNCKMCHGADGNPPAAMQKMMPTLTAISASFMAARSDDSVVKVLTSGTAKMKPYKDKLSAEEMMAVAKYVRELAQKAGGPS